MRDFSGVLAMELGHSDKIGSEIEVTTEGFLVDLLADIKVGINSVIDFFKGVYKIGLIEYLEKANLRVLSKDLSRANYTIKSDLKDKSFSDIRKKELSVAEGFGKDMHKIIEYLDNLEDRVKEAEKVIEVFNTEIGMFISNEDYRSSAISKGGFFKEVEKRQFKIDKEIKSLTDSDATVSTIGALFGNNDIIVKSFKDLNGVLNKVDEGKIIDIEKSVKNTRNRFDTLIEIMKNDPGSISKEVNSNLKQILTVTANEITLLGKEMYLLVQSVETLLRVYNVIRKK